MERLIRLLMGFTVGLVLGAWVIALVNWLEEAFYSVEDFIRRLGRANLD